MHQATLRGADHPELGEIAATAEGRCAIALSRGGAKKRYPHLDPNEDVAAFAQSEWGAVAVVADGHAGCIAAEVAVKQVLEAHAPRWLEPAPIALDARFRSEATDVAADVNVAILKATTGGEADGSRTTLAVALVRPRDGWLAVLSAGDSHAFRVLESGGEELAPHPGGSTLYLGDPALSREGLDQGTRVALADLAGTRALVLATDGLSERGIGVADPSGAAARAVAGATPADPSLRALDAARGVVGIALEAHRQNQAGDNAAAAVLWFD